MNEQPNLQVVPAPLGKRLAKLAFRVGIFSVICFFIWQMIARSLGEFRARQFELKDLDPAWLTVAGALYLVGCVPSWVFWHHCLTAMGQRPTWTTSLRAFFIGHLGKYVPGKAMVVIMRATLVRGPTVDGAVAAAAVFIETLTAMAVGGAVAAAYLAYANRNQPLLLAASVIAVIVAGGATWPPIFRRLVLLLRVQRYSPTIEPALHGLNAPLMVTGWFTMACGWVVMGLSLWATLQSLPNAPPELSGVTSVLPKLTACVALAVVAGFAAMLPGGVGARELVIMTLVAQDYGPLPALAAAVLLRLVWLVAEVVISGLLWFAPNHRQ